jgi:nucleoside-diphosphate-sugar epimerase
VRVPKPLAKAGAWVKEQAAREGEEPFVRPWMVDLADAHRPVSVERARTRLGWEPRHRLRDTLPAMVEGLRRDPEAWYRENGIPFPDASEGQGD